MPHPLSNVALNRALLGRQHLLGRTHDTIPRVVEHLVGLQAQEPWDPYPALWSRIAGFDPHMLGQLVEQRRLVRLTIMRGTLHLVTVRDAHALRRLIQPVLEKLIRSWRPLLAGADEKEVAQAALEAYKSGPLSYAEIGTILHQRFPQAHSTSLARVAQVNIPLIQTPPRGVWGKRGPPRHEPLQPSKATKPDFEGLVLRYLRAFGPASVQDAQAWSGLTRLDIVFKRLEPKLEKFTSPAGKTLYDLPDAPRPPADTHAPPRFLPIFDNVTLGLRDRARMFRPGVRLPAAPANSFVRYVLVDGTHAATWKIVKAKKTSLEVKPFVKISRDERQEILEEGEGLLRMYEPNGRLRGGVRVSKPIR